MVSDWLNRRPSRGLLAVGITACVLAGRIEKPGAGALAPVRSDAVAQVRALAKAMYPSLVGQALRARVVSDLYVDVEALPLNEFRYSIVADTNAGQRDLLTVVVYRVDDNGMIGRCAVTGPVANSEPHMALLKRLWEHPDSSEAQDLEALRGASGRFGPENRAGFLAQTLPRLRALGPHWGHLATWTAEFEGRYREGGNAQPVMSWRMEVALRTARGTQRYKLTFEALDGNLLLLSALSPPPKARVPR